MVAFILQEADERCTELRIRTEHDFELTKQHLVHAGKLKVQDEFEHREKDLAILERVQSSAVVSSSRVKRMKAREALLLDLKGHALQKLSRHCQGSEYQKLLQEFIVQGLLKIDEDVVEVQCREEDVPSVNVVLDLAVAQYKQLMLQAGHDRASQISLVLSSKRLAPGSTMGGVVLVARNNRILVNQTIEARLDLAYAAVQPKLRSLLFPVRI